MHPVIRSIWYSILIIILNLALAAFVCVLALVPIKIAPAAEFSSTHRTVYTAFITVASTILTAIIVAELRELWMRHFDTLLDRYRQDTSAASQIDGKKPLQILNSRWRTTLRIGGIRDSIKGWKIEITYAIAALITTALVASCTPTTMIKSISFRGVVQNLQADVYTLVFPEEAGSMFQMRFKEGGYFWDYSETNDSRVYLDTFAPGSAINLATPRMGTVGKFNTSSVPYSDMGVGVHASAAGVPLSFYSPNPAEGNTTNLFRTHGLSLRSASMCLPTMISTPYACQRIPVIGLGLNGTNVITGFSIRTSDGRCQVSSTTDYDLTIKGPRSTIRSIGKVCSGLYAGQAQVLIAAENDEALSLSDWMDDREYKKEYKFSPAGGVTNESTYGVSCTVDARRSFANRLVTLEFTPENAEDTGYGRVISARSGQECEPEVNMIGPTLFAFASVAAVIPAQENQLRFLRGVNGTGGTRIFTNSKNSLEDGLGLITALVSSVVNLEEVNNTHTVLPGTATVAAIRVGAGTKVAMVFALPPFLTAIFMVVLLLTGPHGEVPHRSSELDALLNMENTKDSSEK